MIGVVAHPEERDIVEEFFELFKTPWEFARPGRVYRVILSTNGEIAPLASGGLLLAYGVEQLACDKQLGIKLEQQTSGTRTILGVDLPIYCGCCTVKSGPAGDSPELLTTVQWGGSTFCRIGYGLFAEIRHLLRDGQPSDNALVPTLDLHLDVLRQILLRNGVEVIEVPPVPAEYRFIGCLTHDIDFVALQQHLFDHTMAGFVYRATIGSLIDLSRGYRPVSRVFQNLNAVLKLPFVYLGLAEDFWIPFQKYLQVENGRPSTFFIVPVKNTPGKPLHAAGNRLRATSYDISDVAPWMSLVCEQGGEIALHGIDAWSDISSARAEASRVEQHAPDRPRGVRMHWLYFSATSPEILDVAGFDYDSTCGYNEAVGYRAGTSQVFKPVGAKNLLELPMHIQDTALFYPGRMHLKEEKAWNLCLRLIAHSEAHGGVLTILWHDRSLVPERLWGDFYVRLMTELDARKVWWVTAQQATDWFRGRRALRFLEHETNGNQVRVDFAEIPRRTAPDFLVRLSWMAEDGTIRQTEVPLGDRKRVTLNRTSFERAHINQPGSLTGAVKTKSESTALAV